jgi:dihydrolipoamide dehydrogenase
MHAEKAKAVKELTGGIAFLFKKNKVEWLKGHAAFTGQNSIDVAGKAYTAKNIVIATGSSVRRCPASRSTTRW